MYEKGERNAMRAPICVLWITIPSVSRKTMRVPSIYIGLLLNVEKRSGENNSWKCVSLVYDEKLSSSKRARVALL